MESLLIYLNPFYILQLHLATKLSKWEGTSYFFALHFIGWKSDHANSTIWESPTLPYWIKSANCLLHSECYFRCNLFHHERVSRQGAPIWWKGT
ncbi:hypothetical protein MNBD_CPR01-232 [hydrothermal vent metagenome]|uniref:Uncharacterized protein n=1 Tax=hydrothermal vent metagenome TaxID=652676 RepID=A0A3B0VIH7_9ZZZZ